MLNGRQRSIVHLRSKMYVFDRWRRVCNKLANLFGARASSLLMLSVTSICTWKQCYQKALCISLVSICPANVDPFVTHCLNSRQGYRQSR